MWNKWILVSSKRHLMQNVHVHSVTKLQNPKKFGNVRILTETQEDRKLRAEVTERKRTDTNMVKVLIDNVFLAIKINAAMLSIRDIHDHLAPLSWHSKNYTFEFLNCINSVIENQLLHECANLTLIR
jgi:hypothetical protein